MIECESLNQAQWIHDQNIINCNYIYVQPPSVEELSNRIIRNRPGLETKESLNLKMAKAVSEMDKAKRFDWISVFTNTHEKEFLNQVTVFLIFKQYHLR